MAKIIRIAIITATGSLICAGVSLGGPSAYELIERHEKTRLASQTQIGIFETLFEARQSTNGYRPSWHKQVKEVRYDGKRFDMISSRWRNLDSADAPTPPDDADNYRSIWDGEAYFHCRLFTPDNLQKPYENRITMGYNKRISKDFCYTHESILFGILTGDLRPVSDILKDAGEVAVRKEMEQVAGSACYVLDAVGDSGRYTIWLDPAHGYNIAKAKVEKTVGDLMMDRPLGQKPPKPSPEIARELKTLPLAKTSYIFELDSVHFEEINGIWVPMQAEVSTVAEYGHGKKVTTQKIHCRRTHIELNPDFEAIGAFDPDIQDGMIVSMPETGIKYIWQQGRLVPQIDEFTESLLEDVARSHRSTQPTAVAADPAADVHSRAAAEITTRADTENATVPPSPVANTTSAFPHPLVIITALFVLLFFGSLAVDKFKKSHSTTNPA